MRVKASSLRLRNPWVLLLERNQLIDQEKSGANYVALDRTLPRSCVLISSWLLAHAFLLLRLLVRLLLVARSSGPATLLPRALTVAGTS
jgi:hypothetical protein